MSEKLVSAIKIYVKECLEKAANILSECENLEEEHIDDLWQDLYKEIDLATYGDIIKLENVPPYLITKPEKIGDKIEKEREEKKAASLKAKKEARKQKLADKEEIRKEREKKLKEKVYPLRDRPQSGYTKIVFLSDSDESSSESSESEEEENICVHHLMSGPRKGEKCDKKVSLKSKTKSYCALHIKFETKLEKESTETVKKETITNNYTIRKNEFGNFEHSGTKFILSPVDKAVIGKQADNGKILQLDEEDVQIARRYRFKIAIVT